MFRSKSKKTRSNLAALVALAVVAAVASVPLIGTMLEGGPDSVANAMQIAADAHAKAQIEIASN